jgi:hypothetical protein
MPVDLTDISMGELMAEVGRRLACSEKKAQNVVLVGGWGRGPAGRPNGRPGRGALLAGAGLGAPLAVRRRRGAAGRRGGGRRGGRSRRARGKARETLPTPAIRAPRPLPPGPPGCGKGTQSPAIKKEYCLCHLATGGRAGGDGGDNRRRRLTHARLLEVEGSSAPAEPPAHAPRLQNPSLDGRRHAARRGGGRHAAGHGGAPPGRGGGGGLCRIAGSRRRSAGPRPTRLTPAPFV